MSFRGDDQRRYGHVPPVQYPVANQSHEQSSFPARRPSFNQGDDGAPFDPSQASAPSFQNAPRGEEELFLTSPTDVTPRPNFPSAPSALSGYQAPAQYQPSSPPGGHSSYNPQNFPRSQSTSLPYHPTQAARYSNLPPASYGQQTTPTNYTPQAYNPAAYASVPTSVPQRNPTYHGYSNYGSHYNAPPAATGYGSPGATYNPTFPQTSQSSTPSIPQYDPSLPSPPPPTSATSQTASYDPAYSMSYGGGQYSTYSSNGNSPAMAPYSAGGTSAPYPTISQIPVGPHYSVNDPSSFFNRASRSNSQNSGIPSPPAQTSPGLQRHPTNAPLPSRPSDDELHWGGANGRQAEEDFVQEHRAQEDIINDIEAELGGSSRRRRPSPINGQQLSDEEMEHLRRYDSSGTAIPQSARASDISHSSTVGRNHQQYAYEYDDGDESDPEGTAGVLAMQQAELDDRRFSGNTFTYDDPLQPPPQPQPQPSQRSSNPLPPPPEEQSSDSDFGGMDLGLFSGGYAGNLTYGNNVGSPPATATATTQDETRPSPAAYYNTYPGYDDSRNDAPAFHEAAMDYPEAGGLQPPDAHRMSYDDGEERVSVHSRQSGSESPYKDDYPDIFYHPGLSSRPLPALPAASDTSSLLSLQTSNRGPYQHSYSLSADSRTLYSQDGQPDYASPTSPSQQVERSISLSSHSTTPAVQAPMRSRTDAADERRKMYRQMAQQAAQSGVPFDYDTGTPSSAAYDMITIPTGRRKKAFIPSKLSSHDMKRCTEPWALSGIAAWVREMAEGELDLKQKTIEEGLIRLFTTKVPTMNVADAEVLSTRVVEVMLESGILIPEEEWVKFGPGSISGVLWQLTGSGCYSPKLHEVEIAGRCYSYHCTRTLKKANLDELLSEDSVKQEDWATFFKLTKDSIEGKHKKEIERQNVLHEIVTSEEGYMNQLEVLRVLYRDQLRHWQPPIIVPNKIDKFLNAVFGKVDAVLATNRDNLLAQLKYRQKEQGPWIVGFSDLFREWIRKAKTAYIDYAGAYPHATYMVRREAERNLLFRQFLDQVRNHKRSERLDWTHFLKTPITRLQRYTFLLETVKKNMLQDSEEKSNLAKAIQEIHEVTLECDARVAEMQKKVVMAELNSMLVLRPGFQSMLNLDHLGRELLMQGDLQRMGSKGVRWVDTHALLFDHYLILAKVIAPKDGRGEKKYDVSKEPIPMPLLFLESANDDAVSKQKSLTAPLARTTTSVSDTKLNKIATNGSDRPGLEHAATSSSTTSANRLAPGLMNDSEGKILYPFKVKHLGHEVYTLYASTPDRRQEWCQKIIEAKTRHAKALFSQNAEPFRLRVLADSAFAYDSASGPGKQPGVPVRGTPLDRAIRELEQVYGPGRGPAPVCRAQVNCATGFFAYGKSIIAIGTDYGVFISDATDPRGWQRTVTATKVTQIAILEEFSVCLIIADRSLISYPLDVVAPVSNFPAPVHDNPRRAPQRLAKDVAFFAAARMKERMLVFYKKKEGVHNTFFKVLEPVFQKATEKKSRLFGSRKGASGATESFRDYDEFFFPTECYSLNLFQTYIAVSTAKGFELLTLDKKQPMSIPDLKQPAIANIASRIREQKPLGMFRLNDQEFLLTYEDCAVYVDKHGDVSRTLIMEYSGKQRKSRGATLCGQYLLLFNEDYVEVRNAENGRLRQIIAGRDVRCLDLGARGPTGTTATPVHQTQSPIGAQGSVDSKATVKISMSHPEIPGMQIVLEMLLNDGHLEK